MARKIIGTHIGTQLFYLSIHLTPEQQRLLANSLHFSLSIARYQASQRPMPSRSLLSCSAQVVLRRPRGRFQPGPGAQRQRAPITVQSAPWAGISGCMPGIPTQLLSEHKPLVCWWHCCSRHCRLARRQSASRGQERHECRAVSNGPSRYNPYCCWTSAIIMRHNLGN